MKAEDIRNVEVQDFPMGGHQIEKAALVFLQEIAAQLADLNAHLRSESELKYFDPRFER